MLPTTTTTATANKKMSASTVDRAGPDQNGFCRARQWSIEEQAPIKWALSIEQAPIDGFYFL